MSTVADAVLKIAPASHCERSLRSNLPVNEGDCFVAHYAPRNDFSSAVPHGGFAPAPRPAWTIASASFRTILQDRIAAVQARIAAAARRAGRDPAEVTLVAVTKTQPASVVIAAYRAGLRIFGENRVEEAGPKAAEVAGLLTPDPPPAWHIIGHVQSRKAADVLPWASMIHSVDSEKLARRLSRFCAEAGVTLSILLELNVAAEASKYGLAPADAGRAVEAIAALPGLCIVGLMTMAPIAADPEETRPVFAGLRRLRDDLSRRFPEVDWRHLSMGMTDDFEVAVEEGATLVRIGRAIFPQSDQLPGDK
jgi:pyridoxal phosphate enzyme (YggS family)